MPAIFEGRLLIARVEDEYDMGRPSGLVRGSMVAVSCDRRLKAVPSTGDVDFVAIVLAPGRCLALCPTIR
jgi:hypothetical protein